MGTRISLAKWQFLGWCISRPVMKCGNIRRETEVFARWQQRCGLSLPAPQQLVAVADADDIEDDVEFQPPTVSDSSLRAMRRNYIRFLNEAYRVEHGAVGNAETVGRRRPTTHYMSPSAHQRLINATTSLRQRRSHSQTSIQWRRQDFVTWGK